MDSSTLMAASTSAHTLPGSQVLQLADVLSYWEIDATELLDGSGLDARILEAPDARISVDAFNRIVTRARKLTGEPALGIFMGLKRRVTMYGYLGFAALSASTFREALELAVRFSSTITTAVKLSLHVERGQAALRVDETCDVGECRDVALLALILGLDQIGRALTGHDLGGEAQLAISRPPYFDRFENLIMRMRFDQPVTQLVFDANMLDLPLKSPDRAGLRLAVEQCERALRDHRLDIGIVERVRSLIPTDAGFRSLEEVSASLRLSSRTLKRRLASQGVSFSTISDQERCRRACTLVAASSLPLVTVAERLGYSSMPNFARAFRRWTGRSPAAYRRDPNIRTLKVANTQPPAM
ncbi:MAG TPA: AraC family transcriptional regulator [Polyangiales bacterium]|nr:AraC family transcriptional regulator [Polyangiales bacterium]